MAATLTAETAVGSTFVARPAGSELTPRALIAAVIVAGIMGASYPYMVLKLGFGPNVSVVAAFFGFIILSVIARGSYDRWQNNIVQTAGTSAAQTAFMCGVLAAFEMLRASKVVQFHLNPTPLQTFAWLSCASLLGVLLAAPMRRHFIVDEKLPFPDGMAAGETLIVLDPPRGAARGGPEWLTARRAAMVLFAGLLASGLVMLLRSDARIFSLIPEGWDTGALTLGAAGASFVLASMGVGAGYSLLSVGTGLIVGLRINLWLLLGGIIGWILAPLLLIQHGVLPDHATRTQVLYWIMWPGIGMIMAGGLTSLALRWRLLLEAFKSLTAASSSGQEFPLTWTAGGVVVLAALLCLMQKLFFGLPIWMTLAAVVLSVPLMLVGLRALGETNWGPIGALSNLMQGLFALAAPGNVPANILGGGTTGTIAVTSEGLIQDYKAGHMIGSTPRSMTIAQLMGAPIGAAALAVVYPALVRTYGLIGDHAGLAAPGSRRMAGFAELLSGGVSKLPVTAMWAMAVAALLGIAFAIMETNPRLKRWTPSPTGLSLGLLLPFSSLASMFIGALAGWVWQRANPRSAESYLIPLASGLIAGEAMVAVIVPVLLWLGLGHA
ncbi:MAG TPA: OPT family oligopeptide transporter [Caulobacteraceae bacterium]